MLSYKIRMNPLSEQPKFSTVEGEPVVIPGYEEFQFFSHRSYLGVGKLDSTWNISEAITGLSVVPNEPTVAEAKEKLTHLLATYTPDNLRTIIEKCSPRITLTFDVNLELSERIKVEAIKRKITEQEYAIRILNREVGRIHRKALAP